MRPTITIPTQLLYRHIFHRPDVCGGRACVCNTRIPVWVLENCRRLGLTLSEILENYPSLSPLDLYAALIYSRDHDPEIDRDIRENEEG